MFSDAYEESAVVQFGRTVAAKTRTAVEQSLIGTTLRQTGPDVTAPPPGDDDSAATAKTNPILARSTIRSASATLWSRVQVEPSRARVAGMGGTVQRYVTASFGYRWLTSEPEPDVIVIDLRKTGTIGPFIDVLDRSLSELAAGRPSSAVADGVTALEEIVRDRPIAVAATVGLTAVWVSLLALGLGGAISLPLLVAHLLGAVLAIAGVRSRRSLDDVREMRLIQLLISVLEPPEPPQPALRTDDEAEDGDNESS
ncbi:hypothetical protein [Natrinema halophilum]|uniref:Uncharacterized protein n=1 Tax=Natrinema halophilum TaxID=1699371 RepID=A0A7D5GK47_9EURY|nr:hypothetical protein [Natrinema halophilum]QLG48930.1 hypothetical protein HYG82_08735 [Natrinema halophilum]